MTRSKKRWKDLSPAMQRVVVAVGAVQIGLAAGALYDIWKRPPEGIRGRRGAWTAASFVNFIGPLAYFAFGRTKQEVRDGNAESTAQTAI